MSGMISQALRVYETVDPAEAIRSRVGTKVAEMRIGGEDILVGVYRPSEDARTAGGIILPQQTRDEYRWQGITGLVLKIGPLAYRSEKTENWFVDEDRNPAPPKVGDWVMFDVKTSHPFLLGSQPCRFVGCQYIMAIVPAPDLVA